MSPQTVYQRLVDSATRWPARDFLNVTADTAAAYEMCAGRYSYVSVLQEVDALAQRYRQAGYNKGVRVGLLLENRPLYLFHWFALNSLGVSVVPFNPDLRASELTYLIAHSEVCLIVAIASRCVDLQAAVQSANSDAVVISPTDKLPACTNANAAAPSTAADIDTECALLYTSGTTGNPKGCVLPNEYFIHAGHWYNNAGGLMSLRQQPAEHMLTPLPLFHMNAMACSVMAMMTCGGCLTVLDRFHPKSWWQNVRHSGATIIHYLGVMPSILMAQPTSEQDQHHRVRFGFGAGVDSALHAAFEARHGFPLIEAWAMTETGNGAVIAANLPPREVGSNCLGKPAATVEVRVIDDKGDEVAPNNPGELLVRSAGEHPGFGFFREYLKDPEATADAWAEGWFHTGDIVRRNSDGAFYFVDRKKNVIRRSGENIAAVEVESALAGHPQIAQVVVAAVPDAIRGDEVLAMIVTAPCAKKGDRDTDHDRAKLAGAIVVYSLQQLAYYKAPGYVAFVDTIPLTATGKIQRGEVKKLANILMEAQSYIDTRALKKRQPAT